MFNKNYDEKIRELTERNDQLSQIIEGILEQSNFVAVEEYEYTRRGKIAKYRVYDKDTLEKKLEEKKLTVKEDIIRRIINPKIN